MQKTILEYLKERDWDNLHPADLAKSISIESSELLELYQWGRKDISELLKDEKLVQDTKNELADVAIYCFELALMLKFDLGSAIEDKLQAVRDKYPADKVKGNDGRDFYYSRKQEYREGEDGKV